MKKFYSIFLVALMATGIVACDHDDIMPDESNTALTPEELAARNNQKPEENNNGGEEGGGNENTQSDWKVVNTADERADDEIAVAINTANVFQTIEGFGASDCWLGEYVGTNYNDKDKMAKLLFSQDTLSDGSLEGIGLSMWRVNLGGGSAEQGDNSKLEDVTRRAACYLKEDGVNYDWTKCAGQRYFMEEAKKYGVEKMLLFSNSPLVFWTKNGLAYDDKDANVNLTDEGYEKFAEYLAEVSKHFTDNGINIDYISPVNEPQYEWAGGQEGSSWQNSEIAKFVRVLDEKLGSQNTQIIIPEAGKWSATYSDSEYPGRGSQISDFFGSGDNSIADLAHVHKVVAAHSYWEDRNWAALESYRTKAYNEAKSNGIGLWQTEWSMLDEYAATDNYPGLADATYIDNALFLARVIYSDLVWANVSSWSYWTVWGQERWSQKNRFWLIKLGTDVEDYHDNYDDITAGANWKDNANLYVLGNYSRFVRPGYKRVEMNCGSDQAFVGTGFVSGDGNTLVAVYTNLSDQKIRVTPTISGFEGAKKVLRFVTDETKKLERTNMSDGNVVVPAKSVTTVVYCK
ncbi:MAG: hypothetical protein K6F33_00935 [Bacteroidales bacterium]|nr:hypothetical protein [Bacteroidales bacterium]